MKVSELIGKLSQVPGDTTVMSDSGWEIDATDCSRTFYSKEAGVVVFTQEYPSTQYLTEFEEL